MKDQKRVSECASPGALFPHSTNLGLRWSYEKEMQSRGMFQVRI